MMDREQVLSLGLPLRLRRPRLQGGDRVSAVRAAPPAAPIPAQATPEIECPLGAIAMGQGQAVDGGGLRAARASLHLGERSGSESMPGLWGGTVRIR